MIGKSCLAMVAGITLGLNASPASAVLIDFNEPGDLADNFTFSANFTQQDDGGVDGSGSVRPSDGDGTAVYSPDTFGLAVGEVASISMFVNKAAATADTSRMLQLGLGTVPTDIYTTWDAAFLSARVDTVSAGENTFRLALQHRDGDTNLETQGQGDAAGFTLEGARLYQFTVEIARVEADTYTIAASLDDYGPDGLAFVETIASFEPITVTNAGIPADGLHAGFRSGVNAGALRLDNFAVEVIPEPGSTSLLLIGAGLLAMRRGR